jgi:hypothetical protein
MVLRQFCQAVIETLKVFGVALIAATSICALLSLVSTGQAAGHDHPITPTAAIAEHGSPAAPAAVSNMPVSRTAAPPERHALPDRKG